MNFSATSRNKILISANPCENSQHSMASMNYFLIRCFSFCTQITLWTKIPTHLQIEDLTPLTHTHTHTHTKKKKEKTFQVIWMLCIQAVIFNITLYFIINNYSTQNNLLWSDTKLLQFYDCKYLMYTDIQFQYVFPVYIPTVILKITFTIKHLNRLLKDLLNHTLLHTTFIIKLYFECD